METIIFDLNYLGESSQRELDAYRNIGSVRHLKRLSQRERKRRRLWKRTWWALKKLFMGALIAFDIWVFVSWIDIVLHNNYPNPVYQAWNFFTLSL